MKTNNLILRTDSYKSSQWEQYAPNSSELFSYLESRGGVFPATIFFGLQYYLKEYLSTPITIENVEDFTGFSNFMASISITMDGCILLKN